MMNKHGQALIIFILILPLILMICALVIDVGIMSYENKKLEQVTQNILDKKDLSFDFVKETYTKNNISIENLKFQINNNYIEIENKYNINSTLGSILKIKKYEVRIKVKKDLKSDKIIYE